MGATARPCDRAHTSAHVARRDGGDPGEVPDINSSRQAIAQLLAVACVIVLGDEARGQVGVESDREGARGVSTGHARSIPPELGRLTSQLSGEPAQLRRDRPGQLGPSACNFLPHAGQLPRNSGQLEILL